MSVCCILGNVRQTAAHRTLKRREMHLQLTTVVNEAMPMILRLQREKTEIKMEACKFKCFAGEGCS